MISRDKPESIGKLVFIPVILAFIAAAGVVYGLHEIGLALHGLQIGVVRH